jgi:hypothetical protein
MLLAFQVLSKDQTNWQNLETIKQLLSAETIKRLKISYDPLIDPGVNNPQETYSFN